MRHWFNFHMRIHTIFFFFLATCDQSFEGRSFQIAVNCASETKLGHEDEVYEEGVYQLSYNCAESAAKHGVDRYVEVSSGQMWSDKVEIVLNLFCFLFNF